MWPESHKEGAVCVHSHTDTHAELPAAIQCIEGAVCAHSHTDTHAELPAAIQCTIHIPSKSAQHKFISIIHCLVVCICLASFFSSNVHTQFKTSLVPRLSPPPHGYND